MFSAFARFLLPLADLPADSTMSPAAPFKPTVLDVLVVRAMLNASLPIPAELVDTIIEQAEYWAHSQTQTDHPSTAGSRAQIIDDSHSGDRFLVRCPPKRNPHLFSPADLGYLSSFVPVRWDSPDCPFRMRKPTAPSCRNRPSWRASMRQRTFRGGSTRRRRL